MSAPSTDNAKDHIAERAEPRAPAREVHTFDVPSELDLTVTSVSLVVLSAEEELQATKRCRNDQFRLAYELVKQALYAVNGQRVQLLDGSADKAWNGMHPKLRQLVLMVYADMHAPPDGAADAFLKSRRVRV